MAQTVVEVREAVGEARRHGIIVLLVTGRRLRDLHQIAGDLTCFDVIVAENGAVKSQQPLTADI